MPRAPLPETVDDSALLAQFRSGNRDEAFAAIVHKYQERVYWVVRRVVTDPDDADDVAQEVFVRAFKGLQDFRADAQLFTWLYRIAMNVSMNHVRSRRIRKASDIDDLYVPPVSPDAGPDEQLERQEFRRLVDEAIAKLPPKQRMVFQMRYFDEMPYEEIAKVMHRTVGGLKANYFHAVRKVTAYVRRQHGMSTGESPKGLEENEE